jgi:hypothetical protein
MNINTTISEVTSKAVSFISGLSKRAIKVSVAFAVIGVVFYNANPYGIFDSTEVAKAKKIIETKNEIISQVSEKTASKTVLSDKVSANNTKIADAKQKKKDTEMAICGLEKQYGSETIDLNKKCSEKEYNEYVKTKSNTSTGSGKLSQS